MHDGWRNDCGNLGRQSKLSARQMRIEFGLNNERSLECYEKTKKNNEPKIISMKNHRNRCLICSKEDLAFDARNWRKLISNMNAKYHYTVMQEKMYEPHYAKERIRYAQNKQ